MHEQYNIIRRVNRSGGLIGLYKTQQHNVNDQVVALNRTGYRVTFIVSDSWTLFQWIGALLLLVCTLGIYSKSPGLLVVGERIGAPVPVTEMPTGAKTTVAPVIQQLPVGTR